MGDETKENVSDSVRPTTKRPLSATPDDAAVDSAKKQRVDNEALDEQCASPAPEQEVIELDDDAEAGSEPNNMNTPEKAAASPKTPRSAKGTPKSKEEREKERQLRIELQKQKAEEKLRAKVERERQAEEKRLEKERLQKEKEEKRKEDQERRERKRREEEELKEKKEQERAERKKKEEEEKRKKEDERAERKRKEEEEKRKKEEERTEKKRREEEKEEQRRKDEEEREQKKKRESNRFISFFKKEEKPVKKEEPVATGAVSTWFRPFQVKPGMTLAPILRRAPVIGDILKQHEDAPSFFAHCKTVEIVGCRKIDLRAKLFQFHDNYRPPYYGTWRKGGRKTRGRRPFGDMDGVDYEVDSDLEWEDEPSDAEECRSDEEDDGHEEEDEENADFFVEPGYLSDGEGEEDSSAAAGGEGADGERAAENGEERAVRLAARAAAWKQRVLKKATLLVPVIEGPAYACPPPSCTSLRAIVF